MALADIPAVHIIGSPRSGTTWLQLMLGNHPQIATPFELHFFSGFASPWYEHWERHCAGGDNWPRPAYWGLPSALTTSEFEEALGLVVERVYRRVLAAKPTATLMLEKDPRSSTLVHEIVRTIPHVKFIHMLRDGRDVACSIVRASSGFGRAWAPDRPGAAAEIWQSSVRGALTAASRKGAYLEVRYEDLLSERGRSVLRECLSFCGVDDDESLAADLYDRYRYPARSKREVLSGGLVWTGEAVRAGAVCEFPDEFLGPATVGTWEREFDATDRQVFDRIAGDLLIELGYERDHAWAGQLKPRARGWSPLPIRR